MDKFNIKTTKSYLTNQSKILEFSSTIMNLKNNNVLPVFFKKLAQNDCKKSCPTKFH
jgi:hypothetical protein